MNWKVMWSVVAVALLGLSSSRAHAIVTFDWAVVGQDLGNAPDNTGFGSVSYAYRISKHEVTNAQYTEFLNAVDPTGANILGVYNGFMTSNIHGGINFNSGAANGSKYGIKPGQDNNPVVYVDFDDALRFANWLHNGQGFGDTETGAYILLGGTDIPTNGNSITRDAGADFFLTSEDEWYKAAYYDPITNSYFNYATSSNMEPISEAPAGGANSANYNRIVNTTTPVGAYTGSVSPFGTFDQNGNVWEWHEGWVVGSQRGFRGGSWGSQPRFSLAQSFGAGGPSDTEHNDLGFRIASLVPVVSNNAVPEPVTAALGLMGLGVLGMATRRRVPYNHPSRRLTS